MKISVLNRHDLSMLQPPKNSIVVRATSDDNFIPLKFKNDFIDILELYFDDSSENHPTDDLKHGIMTTNHYQEIKSFIAKHNNANYLFVSCDAAQSRSPAIAIGILDFLLNDSEQTIDLIKNNPHWKPNAFVISFFRRDYYNQP